MTEPRERAVVVTGGSRGIGVALVRSFLEHGDCVATCSRKPTDKIEELRAASGDRLLYEGLDLADPGAREAFMRSAADRFGRIDVLVNNAGVAREGVLPLVSEEDIDSVVDLNLKATIHISKLAVRRMLAGGSGGRVINISSIVGLSGYRGLSVYGATKAALDGFTRALARELGSRKITVNSVAPGYLRTEMSAGLVSDQLEQIVRRTPLARLGEAEDVVAAVRFLSSPEAEFITGQVLVVDGGLTA